jgi:enoyl-CoA hydratase/carnithine racemase
VPPDQLDGAVADLTAAVLAGPPGAVAEIKALIAGASWRTYEDQDRAEREAQTRRIRELAGLE